MGKVIGRLAFVLSVFGAAGGAYYWLYGNGSQKSPAIPAHQPPSATATAAPIRYPVASAPGLSPGAAIPTGAPGAMPTSVDTSDQGIVMELSVVIGRGALDTLFNDKDLIRRFVVTVDSAPGTGRWSRRCRYSSRLLAVLR